MAIILEGIPHWEELKKLKLDGKILTELTLSNDLREFISVINKNAPDPINGAELKKMKDLQDEREKLIINHPTLPNFIDNLKYKSKYSIKLDELRDLLRKGIGKYLHIRFGVRNQKSKFDKFYIFLGISDGEESGVEEDYIQLNKIIGEPSTPFDNFKARNGIIQAFIKNAYDKESGGIIHLASDLLKLLSSITNNPSIYFYPLVDDRKNFTTVVISVKDDLDENFTKYDPTAVVGYDRGSSCCPPQ